MVGNQFLDISSKSLDFIRYGRKSVPGFKAYLQLLKLTEVQEALFHIAVAVLVLISQGPYYLLKSIHKTCILMCHIRLAG